MARKSSGTRMPAQPSDSRVRRRSILGGGLRRLLGTLPALLLAIPLTLAGCGGEVDGPGAERDAEDRMKGRNSMDSVAETYVRMVLALGEHNSDDVDAYIGPPEWRKEMESRALTVEAVQAESREALASLRTLAPGEPGDELRRQSLEAAFVALITRTEMLSGSTFTFEQESLALYGAMAPAYPDSHFEAVLERLEKALPGPGPLVDRLDAFRAGFVIPADRLDAVFQAAIAGCRERTLEQMELPAGESFVVEYVTDKSWSAYNWYQGGYQSLIQVNTDLPIYIDRAVDLACHEGYPGHHVYNLLVERDLVKRMEWMEFSVYALFSPRSLIAEGTANFGIEVAFPGAERRRFERQKLYPLAGLDPATAEKYAQVQEWIQDLSYAGNEAARRYLDGEIDAEQAARWLTRYAMAPEARAKQRVRFIDQYRSYLINYNLGQDMVRDYVDRLGGTAEDPQRRWQLFSDLLLRPILPSDLLPEAEAP